MQNDKKTIRTIEVLGSAGSRISALKRPFAAIVLFGMVFPDLLLSAVIDIHGASAVAIVRQATRGNFQEVLASAFDFLGILLPGLLILLMITVSSYLALIQLAVSETPLSSFEALRRGVISALPRGLFLLIFIGLLVGVGQALVIPAIIVGILSLMAPVILTSENKGAWRALKEALTLNYVRGTSFSGWSAFSCLLYLSGLFYLVAVSLTTMSERLLALDLYAGVPRWIYLEHFHNLPFGLTYWSVTSAITILEQIAVAALAFVSATLYLIIVGKRKLGQA